MIRKRSIPLCIILSLVTCGIYTLFWMYQLNEDEIALTDNTDDTSGGMVVLFSIITCNIYNLYWLYKKGTQIDEYKAAQGASAGSNGIIYVILGIFGFWIISYALMQNELNQYATLD